MYGTNPVGRGEVQQRLVIVSGGAGQKSLGRQPSK